MSIPMHPATLRSSVSVGEHPHCCCASNSTSYPRFVRPTKISSLSHVRVALFTWDILDLYASSDSSSSLISFPSDMCRLLPLLLSSLPEFFLKKLNCLVFLSHFHLEHVGLDRA